LDIRDLDVNELLAGLDARPPRQQQLIDEWVTSQGYYPGSTRVPARPLYQAYREWHAQHADPSTRPLTESTWGVQMSRRFKKGRGNAGILYYISRQSDCVIGPVSAEAGRGNPGGPTPGVLPDSPVGKKP
jgi:hypothetical protein